MLLTCICLQSKFVILNFIFLIAANTCNDFQDKVNALVMKIEETKTRSDDPRMLDYYIVQLKENSTIHANGFFNVNRYKFF